MWFGMMCHLKLRFLHTMCYDYAGMSLYCHSCISCIDGLVQDCSISIANAMSHRYKNLLIYGRLRFYWFVTSQIPFSLYQIFIICIYYRYIFIIANQFSWLCYLQFSTFVKHWYGMCVGNRSQNVLNNPIQTKNNDAEAESIIPADVKIMSYTIMKEF